ncbi:MULTISPECIES: hypothetical protein [Aequorivita]|jgi:hypothetical protein|uniref:TerB family tellurite resistance protein n=2 Tax=Aequorivita TaxID=153265 RepID=A0AB35YMC2_9FLAO|nr:hypothetical protein [Aequorivita sp. Ant34-E75]WGF91581.1 hypothetical protein QCQ61_10210 [Aequorivita sp. Ant34-E75]
MENTNKPQLLFYQKMGELFYAIAAADNVVRKTEYDTLKNIVAEKWKNLDEYEDPFHTDAAYQIEIVFDWFDYEQLDANDCFESFADYKKENPNLFTAERKKLIWETADAIASSFAGKNKSEVVMLAKLKMLLSQ